MKLQIEDGCIACGLCVSTCPSVFQMSQEGVAEVYAAPAQKELEEVEEAARNCPVSVILFEKDA